MKPRFFVFSIAALSLALSACDWMPGKPDPANRWVEPQHVVDFKTLYSQNCQACHGLDGTIAGSINMDQPVYLSVLPEETLRKVINEGIPGTNMPGFASDGHEGLSPEQVEALVQGILAKRPAQPSPNLPPYSAPLGDPVAGASAFELSCGACHGEDGRGLPGKAGSVVAPAYLGMVSNQYLRTITIAGRPELGCPDFLNRIPGRPMTAQEISDITAWLVSQRVDEFGQPIPLTAR